MKLCPFQLSSAMVVIKVFLYCFYCTSVTTNAFSVSRQQHTYFHKSSDRGTIGSSIRKFACTHQSTSSVRRAKSKSNDDDDDEIDLSDRDWRDFRAQLVMSSSSETKGEDENSSSSESKTKQDVDDVIFEDDLDGIGSIFPDQQRSKNQFETEAMSKSNFTPLEPSQWAYDSGKVIEKGAVILGGVEQDYGFGLRQQYFHKSVILVLDHDEATFTKGIILNRPSDDILVDEEDGDGGKWRIWFGGDVQGLDSFMPEIVCLHSIEGDEEVDSVSAQVMKNIKWTSFDNAKALVKSKKATPSDFWVFAGYAGWGPGQLLGELDRKSWYMCATDSQTLLLELAKQSAYTDPRDAGLDTWELLMTMIGREGTAEECSGDFEDLMLKEWARENLVTLDSVGRSTKDGKGKIGRSLVTKMIDRIVTATSANTPSIKNVVAQDGNDDNNGDGQEIHVGCVLRASSANRSPFLLEDQEYHKSIVLIISNNDILTAGVILNHPAATSIEFSISKPTDSSGKGTTIGIPVRYGGPYAIRGNEGKGVQQPIWLHMSKTLRVARVGKPVGEEDAMIWKCTQEEAIAAISDGLAEPNDFIVVTGVSVWPERTQGVDKGGDGMKGEVERGRFEVVPKSKTSSVWGKLMEQDVLTKMNLMKNINKGIHAWEAGGTNDDQSPVDDNGPVTDGIAEGFDEEDDSLVFKTDVPVSKLSDDALRSWVATFLLGAPTLGA